MTEEMKIRKPADRGGFYWSTSDDSPWCGPFATDQMARDEFWHDGAGEEMFAGLVEEEGADFAGKQEEWLASYEYVAFMQRPAISTDIFKADLLLEDFEERNEIAVWDEVPPEWPSYQKRELEIILADALYRWVEKHNLWKEFRGLE